MEALEGEPVVHVGGADRDTRGMNLMLHIAEVNKENRQRRQVTGETLAQLHVHVY